jgi:hypothetical protein
MPLSLHQSQEPGPSPSLPQLAGDVGNGSGGTADDSCQTPPTEDACYFCACGERDRQRLEDRR